MTIELSRNDAELVRDVLRQRVVELDREINRTDRFAFKQGLQEIERSLERVIGNVSSLLEQGDRGGGDSRDAHRASAE